MINETISRYRIIEQLGEGRLGVVYKAVDTALGREVAIKLLSSPRRDYRALFLRQARAISGLSHPNIATVFDYGVTAEGQPYVVMEWIKGHPLSEKLQGGWLPLQEAVRIVSTIAETLREAHGHGVIHHDIKPSNVLLTERGEAKVLDFGLVKRTFNYSSQAAKANLETFRSPLKCSDGAFNVPYLAPEQASGGKIDARTDIFALGVVLYECLTGLRPFAGASLNEVRLRICEFTPPTPSHINAQVPPFLDWTTMKAIEKKVEDRYQSVGELISDLRATQPNFLYGIHHPAPTHSVSQAGRKLRALELEFDDLLAKMQTPKSKRATRIAFQSSPAQLGRAAISHARKQR